jgi:hypothetical protein
MEYMGGSDAERTGGRRKRCLSLRADCGCVEVVGAETECRASTTPGPLQFGCGAGCCKIVFAWACTPTGGGGGRGSGTLGSKDLASETSVRVRSVAKLGASAPALAISLELLLAFRIGSADFLACMRHFAFADGMASIDRGGDRRLAMPLLGVANDDFVGSLRAEKKARCRGHCIPGVALLWEPAAGCRTAEVELPDRNSGAIWTEVCVSMVIPEKDWAYLGEVYACQALLR